MTSSTIEVNCIAIIGKQNNPLYIKNFSATHPDLKYHYIAHTSIDVIEERVINIKTPDVYLGLLYAMEDLAVCFLSLSLSLFPHFYHHTSTSPVMDT
ncbi:trafficking protein particle complex subunit 2-like protein [Endogone sp. FLAS-F59071]|nr:trafficking protein particle complex subunit 2-like protein [Endogone sp. FLAS-F59071]|eukprot:RUS18797.1 trafficking protein particle complex subunit 2-like protein [Endogone sp. FLAS-F59071]